MEMSFFPFDCPPAPKNFKGGCCIQLSDNTETKRQLTKLKSILLAMPKCHFPEDEEFLLQFLRVRKLDPRRAATLLDNFFQKLHTCQYLFENPDASSSILKQAHHKCFGILRERDPDGCVVIVILPRYWDVEALPVRDFHQCLMFTIIQSIRSSLTQVTGFKMIFDCCGFNLSHVTHTSPKSIWHVLESMQNCIPFPIKGCYIVNVNIVFKHLFEVVKHMLKKKIRERCHIYGSNLEELHKVLPIALLPEELGGTAGPFSAESWKDLMHDFDQYFTYLKRYGYSVNPSEMPDSSLCNREQSTG